MPRCWAICARGAARSSPGLTSPPMAKANSGDKPGYSRVHIQSRHGVSRAP